MPFGMLASIKCRRQLYIALLRFLMSRIPLLLKHEDVIRTYLYDGLNLKRTIANIGSGGRST